MTDGTIIVFIWVIFFVGFMIDAAVRKDNDSDGTTLVGVTIFTAIAYGAIKLIDYSLSLI